MWMLSFDQQDAEVVCRELDCGAPVQVLGAAAFDKETLRCGATRGFSVEEMNLRFTSVQHHHTKHNCSHDDQELLCAGK